MSLRTQLDALLGQDNADQALSMATEYVRAYTRGQGFPGGGTLTDQPELETVIVSVAARLMSNPQMIAQVSTGPFQQSNMRWDGFTLLEQAVLNRYRIRAQ